MRSQIAALCILISCLSLMYGNSGPENGRLHCELGCDLENRHLETRIRPCMADASPVAPRFRATHCNCPATPRCWLARRERNPFSCSRMTITTFRHSCRARRSSSSRAARRGLCNRRMERMSASASSRRVSFDQEHRAVRRVSTARLRLHFEKKTSVRFTPAIIAGSRSRAAQETEFGY